MTTYNTGNPVGSAAAKDLYDNAENLDVAINSQTAGEWTDRLGNARQTWKGIEDKAEIDIAASASAAAASASAAAASASAAAAGYRDETLAARNDAQAAASAIGPIKFYDTKAQADAAIGTMANGDIIEISQDETRAGARTRYKVQAGALVFVVNLDQTRIDISDPTKGAALVGFTPAGAAAPATSVQAELRAIDGSLPDLVPEPAMRVQPLDYLKDSVGFGYANGDIHINGNLQLGAVRNLLSTTNDLSLISGVNVTKDATRAIKFRGINMQRAYGSNFFSALYTSLSGTGVTLTAGKKYLMSCFVINLADQEKFLWQRSLGGGGDYGHGAKLVDRNVRRIWQLVKATTSTNIDLMPDPTVALGSGANNNPYWIALNRSSASFDVRIGGFQIEQVPDDTKAGVAVIGDSTVAGSAGKKDLAASTEWTRWAEAQLNVPFFNRGVGGETTASMRARWVTDMTPLAVNANYAIIQGGINDIAQGRTLADIQTDIQWMHDQATSDGMQPIVCTCTPTASIQADSAKEAMRQALNVWIKQTFALILDIDKVVRDQSNPALLRQKPGWVGDGVHFDAAAKRAIGIYVAEWPFWSFIAPSPYQERTGNASSVDPVRAGTLFHLGSGYSSIDVSGTGPLNLKNDTRLGAQVLEFSGGLTGNKTVYFQGYIPKLWFVRNTTSGAFVLDVRGVNAAGVAFGPAQFTIGQGKGAWILSTGAGIVRASADI